ncbi:protease adaptor protein RcdA [Enterovirga sp.]|uniref:protease adaptor protein RcdA n=1 Tax=Enterovirga sp. TaxID=2026350 RepID=UPI003FA577A2
MAMEVDRIGRGRVEEAVAPLSFGATFVKSESFKTLFRDGMALVETTACYLDGDGRAESNRLSRKAALAYASESMRLTTRLMQVASWLLVQRALAEGEITPAQARRERDRVKLAPQERPLPDDQFEEMPEAIRTLIAQSLRLHARVVHLDRLLGEGISTPARSPVSQQQRLLRSMFEIE